MMDNYSDEYERMINHEYIEHLLDDTQKLPENEENVEIITLQNINDITDSPNEGELYNPEIGKPLREQDRFLPIANISKIMKKSIPDGVKISKNSRQCVQECVSEFISFITSEASDICSEEKRKTINGEDIIYAMSKLGFENYVEPLQLYLESYRKTIKGDKSINIEELPINIFSNETNTYGENSQCEPVIYFQDQDPI